MTATVAGLSVIVAGTTWFLARCRETRARWKRPVTQ